MIAQFSIVLPYVFGEYNTKNFNEFDGCLTKKRQKLQMNEIHIRLMLHYPYLSKY